MQLKEWKVNTINNNVPLIERLLSARGIIDKNEIEEFLNPLNIKLLHPNAFVDMQKAVERLAKAINNSENILIYGDFDADGLTSTSLMYKTLKYLGANVSYYIPTRETDGHGLNSKALVKLMVSVKPKVIITVDCAISNVEEIKFISSFGVDVILTDHHEAPEILPDAYAIINPKAPDSLDEKLTFKEIEYLSALAGVGVAFKLAQAILEKFEKLEYLYDILPFVAIGTIADIVPLIGENRYFVIKGLELISKGKHYGFERLLYNAGYSNIENGITSEQVAFGIAPRINASGRLDSVDDAIKVLISENHQEVELSAIALDNFNKIRQELCHSIFTEADEMAQNITDNSIILYKPDWHIGIIGIVASKLVEKYHKPAFLMTYSEETNQIRCSARGVEGVSAIHIRDIISNISDLLDGFGGHSLAAGFSFSPDKTTFEDVKKGLITSINEALSGEKIIPVLNIDLELNPDEITIDLIEELKKLEPYGASNPQPVFMLKDLPLREKKLMGSNKEHLKLIFEKDNEIFNAIWWSKGDISLNKGNIADIAFTPQINVFNGNTSVQLILKDIHSEALKIDNKEKTNEIKIYDHRNKTDIYKQVDDYLKTTKLKTSVFAEDKKITEILKTYPSISSCIVNRNTLQQCDTLMLFDYPATSDIYQNVMDIANPKFIHFMNYYLIHNENDFIKTILGMVRFVCNKKQGKFSLTDSSVFLAVDCEIVSLILDMMEEADLIKIIDRSDNEYLIEYTNNKNFDIEHTELYSEFTDKFKAIEDFKHSFENMNLSYLYQN